MKIIHKPEQKSLELHPTNNAQMFTLGRLYQKFSNLGLFKLHDEQGKVIGLELKDASLDKLLLDCIDKFKSE